MFGGFALAWEIMDVCLKALICMVHVVHEYVDMCAGLCVSG